ncbi:hypothetical protein AB0K09_09450 [Streptomyces sp. NPDC049577]|uniref:hypothetical protein n=1 Tax=Streptomyces sp. NPDC049577 TaxID=3155153 RepID=UPI00343130F8
MRGGLVGVAALGVLMASGPAGAAADAEGPLLKAGAAAYADSIRPGERRTYTVELDGESSAYVSAVAVPKAGSRMGMRDGIEVSLRTSDGTQCGPVRRRSFLAVGGAYPVADYAERVVKAGGPCRGAGTYRFVVERGDAQGGDDAPLALELKHVSEPPRKGAADGGPVATGGWSSRAPARPSQGAGEEVTGGSGFDDAAALRPGTWKDELRPGETRFYRVWVDAGEQLFADAEFGAAPAGGAPAGSATTGSATAGPAYVVGGVRLGVNNAARGYVMNRTSSYQGRPATVSLATPPAAYGGANPTGEAVRGMRLEGWYFLQASLSPKVRQARVTVTLRVDVAGARKAEPGEPGAGPGPGSGPGHGGVGGESVAAAGESGPRHERLRIIGLAGIATGTALLLGLGAWTFAARRRGG